MADERRTFEPHDRLTRIADRLGKALEADPEYRGETLIVLLDNEQEGRGGMIVHGLTEKEAIVAMFSHLRAIFRVNGSELLIAPLRRG